MSGKLVFVKRGGASVAEIDTDDLAANVDFPVIDALPMVRAHDLELPRRLSIVYTDKSADYQQATQHSKRMTVTSNAEATINLPIVLSKTKARQIADISLFLLYHGRTSFKFQVSRKWAHLEPTDIVTIGDYAVRLVSKTEQRTGVIEFDAVLEDITIYTQSGDGAADTDIPTQEVTVVGYTMLHILDIPLLRDQDDGAGYYMAACGYKTGWKGSAIYKSIDGGVTYSKSDDIINPASIGIATSVLGDFTGGNIFDEHNSLDVWMRYGELSSTSELAVLNGANVAILGNEVLQFKNAELLAAGEYRLTGLLRGRRGTEWAMDSHAAGERFVIASTASWIRLDAPTSEIGTERYFKPVTFGMTITETPAVPFTNAAVGLECYSPSHVAGVVTNTAGDVVISWIRRGRIGGEWRDSVDVPVGETTEEYELEILNGTGTILRTVTDITTASYTYVYADQLTDFTTVAWEHVGSSTDLTGSDMIVAIKKYGTDIVIGTGSGAGDADVWAFDGETWTQIGGDSLNSGWTTGYEGVQSMTVMGNSLFVGLGTGSSDAETWEYDGATWTKIGGDSLNSGWATGYDEVSALENDGSTVYAGLGVSSGEAEVWSWNGSAWTQIGGDSVNSSWGAGYEVVESLAYGGSKLYAGLGTGSGDAEVWEWNGSSWTQIGGDSLNSGWATGFDRVRSLIYVSGTLYAGIGESTGEAEVWSWNGSAWQKIGGDGTNGSWNTSYESVRSLTSLNGVIYAGLGNGAGDAEVWGWDGATWTKIGGDSLIGSWATSTGVHTMCGDEANLRLYVGLDSDADVWAIYDPANPIPPVIDVNVYQMSASVGRGRVGQGKIYRSF